MLQERQHQVCCWKEELLSKRIFFLFAVFVFEIASRYRTDFEEIEMIGHGGFGEVVKVKNRLDGNFYAVKKVLLDSWDQKANGKILREVTTLSRLHHQHVVRYFQAWIEGTEQEEIEALLARAQVC